MPYKLVKNKIYSKATGTWKLKQTGKSVASAKRALALLQGLESGSIKKEDVGKGKFARKPSKKPQGTRNRTLAFRKSKSLSKLFRKAY